MQLAYQIFTSPLGEILVAGTPHAITHVIRGDNRSRLCSEFLYQNDNVARFGKTRYVQDACEVLQRYLGGECDVAEVAIDPSGSAFERELWQAVRRIPYGKTVTCRALADAIGRPEATDDVTAACLSNPMPMLIPSHRVLGAGGDTGGFLWGGSARAFLLQLERDHAQPGAPVEPVYAGTRIYG
jgi:O-6-methylguanine DNA methyltransferase